MTHSDDNFSREWEKMLTGEIYDAADSRFFRKLIDTRLAIKRFNDMSPDRLEDMRAILHELLGTCPERIHINQPFRCDYGENIHIGEGFFANFNLTILDEAEVRIGRNVFIGPNVTIATACHPLDPTHRRTGAEWAEPVTIGDDVWIGSAATLLPGVTVGNGAVIGASAVVTRDVPPLTVVGGNPAQPIKTIAADDYTPETDEPDGDEPTQLGLDSCGD